jgi:hypothetical protein
MKTKTMLVAGLSMLVMPLLNGCKNEEAVRQPTAEEARQEKVADENRKKLDALNKEYFKVPDDNLFDNGPSSPLVNELKDRYKKDAAKLKELVEATGAKLVFIILTTETDNSVPHSKYGLPYVRSVCSDLGIELFDCTPLLAKKSPKEVTQWPKDGHLSKAGAIYVADNLLPVIKKYYNNTSTVTYKDAERPETFGDFAPSVDEIRDGGKDMPYHVKANAQGVRMNEDITFPKKKKHILFMGDSGIFCPFLDNENTVTGVLQERLPDAVLMNTGVIGYTLEDYITLWNEKAKFSEPDIVFVQTNGGDITDYFFTHRNTLSRSKKPFYPSKNEEEFYKKAYPNSAL